MVCAVPSRDVIYAYECLPIVQSRSSHISTFITVVLTALALVSGRREHPIITRLRSLIKFSRRSSNIVIGYFSTIAQWAATGSTVPYHKYAIVHLIDTIL